MAFVLGYNGSVCGGKLRVIIGDAQMSSGGSQFTRPQKKGAEVSNAAAGIGSRHVGPAERFKGESLDELRDFLIARGEERIHETGEQLIVRLRNGSLLNEEDVSRISQNIAGKVAAKSLSTCPDRQGSVLGFIERMAHTPSKVLGY